LNDLRLWVVLLAAVSALAGLAGGMLLAGGKPPPPSGPFADYERLFASEFQLDPERAELLHQVLRNYHREIENAKQRHIDAYISAMEPELRRCALRYRDLVRNHVLPSDQRERYDQLVGNYPSPETP
jgi:hypothetical protein